MASLLSRVATLGNGKVQRRDHPRTLDLRHQAKTLIIRYLNGSNGGWRSLSEVSELFQVSQGLWTPESFAAWQWALVELAGLEAIVVVPVHDHIRQGKTYLDHIV